MSEKKEGEWIARENTRQFTHICCLVKTRQNDPAKKRVLDEATRTRRLQRQLEKLEKDNFHDDPHAAWQHLANKTKLPTFSDGSESNALQ